MYFLKTLKTQNINEKKILENQNIFFVILVPGYAQNGTKMSRTDIERVSGQILWPNLYLFSSLLSINYVKKIIQKESKKLL